MIEVAQDTLGLRSENRVSQYAVWVYVNSCAVAQIPRLAQLYYVSSYVCRFYLLRNCATTQRKHLENNETEVAQRVFTAQLCATAAQPHPHSRKGGRR